MRPVAFLGAVLALSTPSASDDNLFAFFDPSVAITAANRAILDRGLPFVQVLDTQGHELAVFTAIEVPSSVTPDRMVAWMQNVAEFRKSSYVLAVRRFSSPPRLEDLDTLTLDDGDFKDLEDCRPASCGMKLSDGEMERLQRVIRASGREWNGAVQTAFRQMVLQRVTGYVEKGHSGLEEYRDGRKRRLPAVGFSRMLQHSTFLLERAPVIAEALARESASGTVNGEAFLYWSKERLGGKAVINATHVRIFRPPGIEGVEVLMTGTQIFATHYLDACLGVTALVRDRRTSRNYFVYLNRSDVDLLGGLWGRLARRIIAGRVEDDGPAILREVAKRLASGDPPVASVSVATGGRR
jgi:hypothetical protein